MTLIAPSFEALLPSLWAGTCRLTSLCLLQACSLLYFNFSNYEGFNDVASLTITQVLMFYGPLAGLLGVTFWLGVLTQTVKDLKERVKKIEDGNTEGGMVDRMARLEVNSENTTKALEKISLELSGVQRQLGNIYVKQQS